MEVTKGSFGQDLFSAISPWNARLSMLTTALARVTSSVDRGIRVSRVDEAYERRMVKPLIVQPRAGMFGLPCPKLEPQQSVVGGLFFVFLIFFCII